MKLSSSPRAVFALPALTGVGLVAGGVILAALTGANACPLCIIQRMLFLLVSLFALMGFAKARGARILAALLIFATSATGVFVAGYQVWLQRFGQGETCTAHQPWWEVLVERAGEAVPWLFSGEGICSDDSLTVLGLPLADWALLLFAVLCLHALLALRAQRRQ